MRRARGAAFGSVGSVAVFAALLAAGCGGFSPVRGSGDGAVAGDAASNSDGGAGNDGASANDGATANDGASGNDGATSNDGAVPVACATPELVVGVYSVDGANDHSGSVQQYSLATGSAVRCGNTLSAKGSLPSALHAIMYLEPSTIVVGTDVGIYGVDVEKDTFNINYDPQMDDANVQSLWPVKLPDTSWAIGAGMSNGFIQEIGEVLVLGPTGKVLFNWDTEKTPLPIGLSVTGITQSPVDPGHILYIDASNFAAGDIALPFSGTAGQPATHYYDTLPNQTNPMTIYAIPTSNGGGARTAWIQVSTNDGSASIYTVNDKGSGPLLDGPFACTDNKICHQPFKSTFAVPDPTTSDHVFATCDAPANQTFERNVVRISSAGCELVVDGSKLPALQGPYSLAIRQ